jgi:hypothetical protein
LFWLRRGLRRGCWFWCGRICVVGTRVHTRIEAKVVEKVRHIVRSDVNIRGVTSRINPLAHARHNLRIIWLGNIIHGVSQVIPKIQIEVHIGGIIAT